MGLIDPVQIGLVFVLPLLVAAALAMLLPRLRRLPGARLLRDAAPGVAIVLGYGVAHIGVFGWPRLNPSAAEHVALVGAGTGGLIALATARFRSPRPIGRYLIAFGIVWLVIRWKMITGQWSMGEMIAGTIGISAAVWWLWTSLLVLRGLRWPLRLGSAAAPDNLAVLLILTVLSGLLIVADGAWTEGSMAAFGLGAALLGCAPMVLRRRKPRRFVEGAAPVVALSLGMLLIHSHFGSSLRWIYALVILVTPTLVLGARVVVPRRINPVISRAAPIVLGLLPLLVVTLIEVIAMLRDPSMGL